MKAILTKWGNKYLNIQTIIVLFILMSIFFALSTRFPEAIGESDDYMLSAVAIKNHFSLRITEEDVAEAKEIFPNHAWYFQSSWEAGMPALFSVEEGQVYPWYMGTYSLICIPMLLCLGFLGLDQSYAFALTNAILAIVSLWTCNKIVEISAIKKLLLLIMLGFSPVWWYIRWPSAEVFIYSLMVISLAFFSKKQYHLAGLFVSLAGTMNISVMAYGFFIIVDYTKEKYLKYTHQGEKNILVIMQRERNDIGKLVICFLPSLVTPIYNLIKFRLINLQSILGFATMEGYGSRVWSHLFDLNIGFLPYFILSFPIFFILLILGLMKRKWSAFIYAGAFIGTVMMYSVTYHINSGMSGLPRYSVWTFPIFVFYIIIENNFLNKRVNYAINMLLLISTVLTVGIVHENRSELEQTKIAKWVLSNVPTCYNPYYPIFISRVAHLSGGYTPYEEIVPEAIAMGNNYEDYFPVIYCNAEGKVRKILSIPEVSDRLLEYFEGDEDSLLQLSAQIEKNKFVDSLFYINIKGNLEIKDEYINKRFSYAYGNNLKSGTIPLSLFRVQDGGEIGEDAIVIPPDVFQYGPYKSIKKGAYTISVFGEQLNNYEESVLADNRLVEIKVVEKTNNLVKYDFNIEEDVSNIEFRGLNVGKEDMYVYKLELECKK